MLMKKRFAFLAVGGSLIASFAGCSTTPSSERISDSKPALASKNGSARSSSRASRSPAAADEGCMLERESGKDFESFVSGLQKSGAWSRSDLKASLKWTTDQRRQAIVNALAEAYTYGNVLVDDFNRLVGMGYSLETLTRKQSGSRYSVYSQLMALRAFKDELLEVARDQFGLDVEAEHARTGNPRRRAAGAVSRSYREMMDATVKNATTHSVYYELALDELENLAGDAVKYYSSCDPQVFGSTGEERFDAVVKASRELDALKDKQPGFYKRFQPKGDTVGFNVEAIVKHEARKAYFDLTPPKVGRGVQSVEPVYFPDVGPKGNIVGGGFPKGSWSLTFDDGPGKTTAQVLDNLAKHKMKATFFVLSQQIQPASYPTAGRRELTECHDVNSHSYTHANVPKQGAAGQAKEITQAIQFLDDFKSKVTVECVDAANPTAKAHPASKSGFFRLPYGSGLNVASVRKLIKDAGKVHVFWNVDTLDWQIKDPQKIYDGALKQMRAAGNRGVILFHDIHSQSVVASEMIMAYLTNPANGTCPVTIAEIVEEMNAAAREGRVAKACPSLTRR